MGDEEGEQRVFEIREVDGLALDLDLIGREVERERPLADEIAGGGLLAGPCEAPDPSGVFGLRGVDGHEITGHVHGDAQARHHVGSHDEQECRVAVLPRDILELGYPAAGRALEVDHHEVGIGADGLAGNIRAAQRRELDLRLHPLHHRGESPGELMTARECRYLLAMHRVPPRAPAADAGFPTR